MLIVHLDSDEKKVA
jgi:hypothetical protein